MRLHPAVVALFGFACGLALFGCRRTSPATRAEAQRVEQGRALYDRMCAVCHGPEGEGYKADQAPRLSHPDFLASVNDAFLRRAIMHGRQNTTMSAWGAERGGPLSRADVDALVLYLRHWQRGEPAKLDERPRSGDAARGRALYERECQRCHGAEGVGGPNLHIGDPDLLLNASDGFLRLAIGKGRKGTPMPGFSASLGAQGVEDLVQLLRSFGSAATARERALRAPVRPPPIPLGPVPLNPHGPEPVGFLAQPGLTPVEVVKAALDRGARFSLLDARAPPDYVAEHIAGAVSVPFYDPEPYFDKLPKDSWLVCYCACPHAESGTLARKLVERGFHKVTVLDEGLGVWKAKKYPTQQGERP